MECVPPWPTLGLLSKIQLPFGEARTQNFTCNQLHTPFLYLQKRYKSNNTTRTHSSATMAIISMVEVNPSPEEIKMKNEIEPLYD